jgi:flagellar biogenesis protein FliO
VGSLVVVQVGDSILLVGVARICLTEGVMWVRALFEAETNRRDHEMKLTGVVEVLCWKSSLVLW